MPLQLSLRRPPSHANFLPTSTGICEFPIGEGREVDRPVERGKGTNFTLIFNNDAEGRGWMDKVAVAPRRRLGESFNPNKSRWSIRRKMRLRWRSSASGPSKGRARLKFHGRITLTLTLALLHSTLLILTPLPLSLSRPYSSKCGFGG